MSRPVSPSASSTSTSVEPTHRSSRPARDPLREPREHAALRALLARRPARGIDGQNARRPAIRSAAGSAVRLNIIASATPAAPSGPIAWVPPTRASSSVSSAATTVPPEARIAGAGAAQRGPHRHVRVLLAFELLPVAGDQQQRVVRRRAEDQDGQDAAALPGDRQARRAEQVCRPAGGRLGEDDDEERDRPEDRRAVDEHEQDQDDRAGDREQRHVDALEHAADVGRERRAARHRDLQAVTAALGAADPLAQARDRLVGRVVARVAQRDGEQRRLARELRLADADGERRRVALERAPVVADPRAVLLGQPARAPVDGDRRRHLVAELLGCAHHMERFGAFGQRRGEIQLVTSLSIPLWEASPPARSTNATACRTWSGAP